MRPRYVVSSVTGHAITPSGATTGMHPSTIWTVLDSAFCYQAVTSTVKAHSYMGVTSFNEKGERRARDLAAELNALDLLWPGGRHPELTA